MELFKSKLISLLKEFGLVASEPKEEEMIAIELIFEPDVKDAHGQWMSKETIHKACENFNENLEKGVVQPNLFHLKDTNTFEIAETWIQKEFDVVVEQTGEVIKAGSWIGKIQYKDKDLWELKKANVIGGVSIGGKGFVNEETGEITEVTFNGETE